MPSVVDICNLALANLGDEATVASIDPPEGSAQAEHCARFYPIARDALLEMHAWNFATRRAALALLSDVNAQWDYVYAFPNSCVKVLAVIEPDAADDFVLGASYWTNENTEVSAAYGTYTPQPYSIETLSTGEKVIVTNVEDAVVRYVASITDSAKFGPLFTVALTWLLASMLAGPLIKGDVGAAEAKRCYQMFSAMMAQAGQSDANQRSIKPTQIVPWMSGR
jgi:hypothetical protein